MPMHKKEGSAQRIAAICKQVLYTPTLPPDAMRKVPRESGKAPTPVKESYPGRAGMR